MYVVSGLYPPSRRSEESTGSGKKLSRLPLTRRSPPAWTPSGVLIEKAVSVDGKTVDRLRKVQHDRLVQVDVGPVRRTHLGQLERARFAIGWGASERKQTSPKSSMRPRGERSGGGEHDPQEY